MSKLQEVNARIAAAEDQLSSVKGRDCEVYARIVGYYRSVRNWNAGKREEFAERVTFTAG